MHVYMYLCTYSMYVCTVGMYVYVYTYMYAHIYELMSNNVCTNMHMYVRVYIISVHIYNMFT